MLLLTGKVLTHLLLGVLFNMFLVPFCPQIIRDALWVCIASVFSDTFLQLATIQNHCCILLALVKSLKLFNVHSEEFHK